jgi:hypothetical protein
MIIDDQELEAFKTHIDLRAYAADQGYKLDRKESWRSSSVMRHPSGDKIIVKKDRDGHYVYFSVRDERDNGSIIDFAQRRRSCSLGQVRQLLRPWIGRTPALEFAFQELARSSKDRVRVELAYHRMRDAPRHSYLEKERGISAALLASARVRGCVRIDGRGNAVFPHFDQEGLCGYEIKNRNFTGFAGGGEKGLWLSRTCADDKRLVIAESAIDALSYAQLFPDARTRYASIGGQMNPRQPALVAACFAEMRQGAEVLAAMDADDEGHMLAHRIGEAVGRVGRDDLLFVAHFPEGLKDWNDVLRRDRARPFAGPRSLEAG